MVQENHIQSYGKFSDIDDENSFGTERSERNCPFSRAFSELKTIFQLESLKQNKVIIAVDMNNLSKPKKQGYTTIGSKKNKTC